MKTRGGGGGAGGTVKLTEQYAKFFVIVATVVYVLNLSI